MNDKMTKQQQTTVKKFFGNLKRMFSTDVIVRHVGNKKLNIIDTDRLQLLNKRYSKYGNAFGVGTAFFNTTNKNPYQYTRLFLYRDYQLMDRDPIISSACDIYSDECTTQNQFGEILKIKSQNKDIKQILQNLFYDILNIQFNLWTWIRNLVKYGDFFLVLDIDNQYGIINVKPVSPYDIERIQDDETMQNPHDYYYILTNSQQRLQKYQVIHFRLLSDTNFLPYGRSILQAGRGTWKSYKLMTDALLLTRIMRAPQKRVFKVDIAGVPDQQLQTYMDEFANKMKKVPYVDPQTGQYNLKYNMQNILQDYYIPVRGNDDGSTIQTLQGMEYNATDDVNFFKDLVISSLKIPRAFLTFEDQIQSKSTLSSEDIRFSRTIQHIQKIIISQLTKIAIIHLYSQGFDDEELIDFQLELTNPSTTKQIQKMQLWTSRINLGKQAEESGHFSNDWIYKNIYNMSDDEITVQRKRRIRDQKFNKLLQQEFTEDESQYQDETEETDNSVDAGDIETDLTGQQATPLQHNFTGGSPLALDKGRSRL